MASHAAYVLIFAGLHFGIEVIFLVILALIGLKSVFFLSIGASFGLRKVSNNDEDIILDVFGNQVNFAEHRRMRIALRIIILVSFHVVAVVFVDGCILSKSILTSKSSCPTTPATTCFYFGTIFSIDGKPFDCSAGEPISAANVTAEMVMCYAWEIKSQSAIGILNQLGICSSILALIGVFFKFLYYLANRRYWGIPVIVGLGLIIIVVPIIVWTVLRTPMSLIIVLLVVAGVILLASTLFLALTVQSINNRIKRQQIDMNKSKPFQTIRI